MRKKILLLFAVGVAVALAAVLAGCASSSFSGSNMLVGKTWTVTGNSNGTISRDIKLEAEDLAAFVVASTNEKGTITMEVTQNSTTKTYEINGTYGGVLDLSTFSPVNVKIYLICKDVKGLNFAATWGIG